MAGLAPRKPWEGSPSVTVAESRYLGSPPPVPERPTSSVPSRYMSSQVGRSYHGGYSDGYNGFGGYGGYQPHHYPYDYTSRHMRLGYPGSRNTHTGTLFQDLQENGRSAFEMIERLVFAVSSVSAMLESSYDALYSSFMAVASVADHIDQLKEQTISIIKSLVRLRPLRRILAKFIRLLRCTPPSFLIESEVATSTESEKGKLPWPLIVFFALVVGSPFVIYSMMRRKPKDRRRPVQARAVWDYHTEKNDELRLTKNEIVTIYPPRDEPEGWVTAESSHGSKGLIPKNYVRLIPRKKNNDAGVASNHPTRYSEPDEQELNSIFEVAQQQTQMTHGQETGISSSSTSPDLSDVIRDH
eukprot:gene10365-2499_t